MCMLSHFSHTQLFSTLYVITHHGPLSMEFSRWEYWSELPFSPPGDPPDPGIKPASLGSPALAGRFFTVWTTTEALVCMDKSVSEMKSISCVWVFATPWTVAYHAPLSMGFSRQEYWSGVNFRQYISEISDVQELIHIWEFSRDYGVLEWSVRAEI